MDSTITDFLRQIPAGLILMFCGSGVLLIGVISYFVYARGRRARAAINAANSGGFMTANPADMPDLDALSTVENFAVPSAPATRAARSGTFRIVLNDGGSADAVEVGAVLRDVVDGSLIVQIGDKAYRHPPMGADADFMRRYEALLRGLAEQPEMVEKSASDQPASASTAAATPLRDLVTPPMSPTAPPMPEAAAEPETAAAENAPVSETIDADNDKLELPSFDDLHPAIQPPPVPPGVSLPGDLPKFTLDNTPEPPRRGRRPPADPIPEINIAAAIETYLQYRLQQTGALPGRKVHIRSGLGGAVVIEVDGRYFDSVGEIDDDDVRGFISAVIAEWQDRQ